MKNNLLKILSVSTTAILLGSVVTVGTGVTTASIAVAADDYQYETPAERRTGVRVRKHNVRVQQNTRRWARVARLKKARTGVKERRANRVERLKEVREDKKSRR